MRVVVLLCYVVYVIEYVSSRIMNFYDKWVIYN